MQSSDCSISFYSIVWRLLVHSCSLPCLVSLVHLHYIHFSAWSHGEGQSSRSLNIKCQYILFIFQCTYFPFRVDLVLFFSFLKRTHREYIYFFIPKEGHPSPPWFFPSHLFLLGCPNKGYFSKKAQPRSVGICYSAAAHLCQRHHLPQTP